MNLIRVKNKQTEAISHVSEEWLTQWPDDFTRADTPDSPQDTPTPATGTNKKEKA